MASRGQVSDHVIMRDPPFVLDLFNNTRWAWLWLILRLYLGYTWLTSGLEKVGNPGWTQTGQALAGFWKSAVQIPAPPARPPIAFEWYRSFLQWMLNVQAYTWFSKLIVASELIVGVMLLIGAFVGIASFAGAFLNWNFMMAGSASINPLMFIFTILLILAWKTAGWIGLDRWLLRALGTPWQPGRVFQRDEDLQGERERSAVPITGPYTPVNRDRVADDRDLDDPSLHDAGDIDEDIDRNP